MYEWQKKSRGKPINLYPHMTLDNYVPLKKAPNMEKPGLREAFMSKPNAQVSTTRTYLARGDKDTTSKLKNGETDPLLTSVLLQSGAFSAVEDDGSKRPPPGLDADMKKRLANSLAQVSKDTAWGGKGDKGEEKSQ